MKKYTVVYGDWFQVGSHRNSVTHFKQVEGMSVKEAIESVGLEPTDVWFVFDGHCQETKD